MDVGRARPEIRLEAIDQSNRDGDEKRVSRYLCQIPLVAKPLRTASLQPRRLFFSALRRRIRLKRVQEVRRNPGNSTDRRLERFFVSLRRLIEAADLSNELE